MLLKDKFAVVTGGNRGIGLSIVRTFLDNGADVIVCVRSVECSKDIILSKVDRSFVDRLHFVELDLSDEISIKAAVKSIVSINSKIEILVNNAGVASGGLFQMLNMQELKRVFDINFFGQILFTQGVARLMQRNKCGTIINIASTAAQISDPGTITYGTSKAALIRATQSMAAELGGSNIRVNAIAPGVTRTDMYDEMAISARDKLINASSLKRPAEPEDIANAALFFASNLSEFVTGQVLRVDGGIV